MSLILDIVLLSIAEVSQKLRIKANTLYSWVNQRKIPYLKVGRLVKFDSKDIENWLNAQKISVQEW